MIFNDHSNFEGQHAFLSASQYHWINYTDDKLITTYQNMQKKEYGTRLHALAAEHIALGIPLPKTRQTLNMFVNHAIGFRMKPEVILMYSTNWFGTADAISFDENKKILRIHDLKTGDTPAHMEQLYIYAALFCLEYHYNPEDIKTCLRIYQSCSIVEENPEPEIISQIINTGKRFDKLIDTVQEE